MTIVTIAFDSTPHKHYDYLLKQTGGSREATPPKGRYLMSTARFGHTRHSLVDVVGTREVAALPTHVTATFCPLVNHTAISRPIIQQIHELGG